MMEWFRLTVRTNEERETLSSDAFTQDGECWVRGGLCVRLLPGAEGKRLAVQNDGGCVVEQVRFPICPREDSTQYDQLLFATAWGDNLHEPTQAIRAYWQGRDGHSDSHQYIKYAPNEVIYLYPSVMAMQFVTLYNDDRSFYLACYSTGEDSLSFHARATSWPFGLELSVGHYPYLEKGEWVSPPCESAILGSGWRPAADRYMRRMGQYFADPDWPAWMKDPDEGFHGWVQVPMKYQDRPALCAFRDLPALYREKAAAFGLNTIHVYGWCNEGHDTRYCDYDPNPELGTAEELRTACEEIRAMGGHVVLYMNGRIFSPGSRFGRRFDTSTACKDEQGRPYDEIWGPGVHYHINCPTQTEFHDELRGTIRRYITEYGAGAAQIDQISCNYGEFCFDKSHAHRTPASNFLPGVTQELMTLREAHKALDPDFFTWLEGCHERFGQYTDVEQGHGETYSWQIGESLPEQYQYCFKERIVTGLGKNLQQLCHSFLQGKPFDLPLGILSDETFGRVLRRFVALRRRYPEFYLTGRFMADEGVETDRRTRAGVLLTRDGSRMLIALWRRGCEQADEAQEAFLRVLPPHSDCLCAYPDDCRAQADGSWLTVRFSGPVAVLIFDLKQGGAD